MNFARLVLAMGLTAALTAPAVAQSVTIEGGRGASFRTMANPARNRGKLVFASPTIAPDSPATSAR